ncbi:MAG: hypothetical protein LBL73_08870 [Synergistaceae bacterium]|jgi:hypothetical protein|nr:hypothetical protein [Synergistaceae bacterium]
MEKRLRRLAARILANVCDGDRRFVPLAEAVTAGECARLREFIGEPAENSPLG